MLTRTSPTTARPARAGLRPGWRGDRRAHPLLPPRQVPTARLAASRPFRRRAGLQPTCPRKPRHCPASGQTVAAGASADDLDVLRLGPLLALGDVELDLLPFLQVAVATTGDRAEVHEHVRATVHRDEAVTLVTVEPLHRALCHLDLLCPGYSTPLWRRETAPAAIALASLSRNPRM